MTFKKYLSLACLVVIGASSSMLFHTQTAHAAVNHLQPIPILEYHHIRDFQDKSQKAEYYTSISPKEFSRQMETLKKRGYTSVSPTTYHEGKAPKKSVIITFDDGNLDAYTEALPILQKFHFTAVFYIISGFVGKPDYMNKDQILATMNAGMIIGSHTVDHADLSKVSIDEARHQLVQSKKDIETLIGREVPDFCYPFGGTTPEVANLVKEAGYQTAVTTVNASKTSFHDNLLLPRIAVVPNHSLSKLMKQVRKVGGK